MDEALVCYCFGVTHATVRGEVQRTRRSDSLARVERETRAGNCDCRQLNPAGRCCLGRFRALVDAEVKRLAP